MKLASIPLPNCLSSGTKGFTLMSCRDDSQKLMLYMRIETEKKNGKGYNKSNELRDACGKNLIL